MEKDFIWDILGLLIILFILYFSAKLGYEFGVLKTECEYHNKSACNEISNLSLNSCLGITCYK